MPIQVLLVVTSWLMIPFAWLPGHGGQRRIGGRLGSAVTYVAIAVGGLCWITMPLLVQPRFVGLLRARMSVAGGVLVATGVILWGWSVRHLEPSVGWSDEINPKYLVTEGPYRWMRHPIYVAGVILIVSWILLNGAIYSLLLCPIFYLLFRFEAYLEERLVLRPKFGDEFQDYKEQVQAFFGRVGTAILTLIYLLLAVAVALGLVPTAG